MHSKKIKVQSSDYFILKILKGGQVFHLFFYLYVHLVGLEKGES